MAEEPEVSWQDQAAAYLKLHEGVVDHFYLDVVGLVTIGVGYLVPTVEDAYALDLRTEEGSLPSEATIKAEWNTVHAQQRGLIASYYKKFCTLRLEDSESSYLLMRSIDNFSINLTSRFASFDSFPVNPKIGCVAMIYALGPAGLFRGYPKFCAAVDRQDWKTAADECQMGHVGEAENEALRQLFLNAV